MLDTLGRAGLLQRAIHIDVALALQPARVFLFRDRTRRLPHLDPPLVVSEQRLDGRGQPFDVSRGRPPIRKPTTADPQDIASSTALGRLSCNDGITNTSAML